VGDPAASLEEANPSVDWRRRLGGRRRRFVALLERVTLHGERPLDRAVGTRTLNPLYHTGTMTTLLLIVVVVTGTYLTFFYDYGFEASYRSVAGIEGNLVGRLMRAAHRYASAALVATALLHGWRTLVEDRSHGPRTLAWVSGVAMAAVFWGTGIIGYWLVWDERARLLTDAAVRFLDRLPGGDGPLVGLFRSGGSGWGLMTGLLAAHVLLTGTVAWLLWLHLRRLARAKILPPRVWTVLVTGLLLVVSVLFPLGMLEPLDPAALTGRSPLDVFYLAVLPAALHRSPLLVAAVVAAVLALAFAVPLLRGRRAVVPVEIDEDRCTGCSLCVADCPYRALTLVDRPGGAHPHLAVVDPALCVGCGVCIGSCPWLAVGFPGRAPDDLRVRTRARIEAAPTPVDVVFVCERHLLHGRPEGAADRLLVPVTCTGAVLPALVADVRAWGAASVEVVGCPPEDCVNREGNLWLDERLARRRKPRLGRTEAPVERRWVSPVELRAALHRPGRPDGAGVDAAATAYTDRPRRTHVARTAGVATAGLAVMALLTAVPFTPPTPAVVEVILEHTAGAALAGHPETAGMPAPVLDVVVDGAPALSRPLPDGRAVAFERLELDPGPHHVTVTLGVTVFDGELDLGAGDVHTVRIGDELTGGDPERGRSLFMSTGFGVNTGCRTCHSLEPGVRLVGPSLAGIGERAGTRVAGLDADEYLRRSILDPDAYVVDGFPAGQMFPNYDERLDDQQVEDLIAFLLTR